MSIRLITAGESHGPGLTCIVEGLPAGITLTRAQIDEDLARRQLGHGRGGRMKIERDRALLTGGVRHGSTLGSPISLQIDNLDFANWQERMSPWALTEADAAPSRDSEPAASAEPGAEVEVEADAEAAPGASAAPPAGRERIEEVHLPRPGHADLIGVQKYCLSDVRNVLERASARETAARVAGGALCKAFLAELGVQIRSHVVQIASIKVPRSQRPLELEDFAHVDDSPVRCLDRSVEAAMISEIDALRKANESLGGVFEVQAYGLVPGLGSYTTWEQRLDGRLAMALCSIQAIKGVEIGEAFEVAGLPGSQAQDEIYYSEQQGFYRQSNHCGGLEGGMTTGQPLIVRGAMKPLPTLTQPLRSVDIESHAPGKALRERTDSCTVPAAGVVAEAMVAFALADAYRDKFGGDHIADVRTALQAYGERIGWRRPQ